MTDEEYVFKSDVKEKSKTARSARNAYSSRRRGCHLSTDHITRKEWERMNGPIHSIKLDAPITWEEFKSKPEDLQKQYLDNIFAKYKVGPTAISQLFQIDKSTCSKRLSGLGYSFKNGKSTPEETTRFYKAFGLVNRVKPITQDAILAVDSQQPDFAAPNIAHFSFTGRRCDLRLDQLLSLLFPENEELSITLEIVKTQEGDNSDA